MGDFYPTFLHEPCRPSSAGQEPDLALAVFGKHPGWDDHIEDIGMETESLIQAKQLLYVQGIGGQIDCGAWEKLPTDQLLSQFNHLFLWQRSGRFLLGRFWSSIDGKGRTRYPMVACLHSMGPPLDWMLFQAFPVLEKLQQHCQATQSVSEVQMIVAQCRELLLMEIGSQPWLKSEASGFQEDVEQFLGRPEWNSNHEGLMRILHQFQNQINVFKEARRLGSKESLIKSQQIRIPVAANSLSKALLVWSQFFLLQLPLDLPLLMVTPLGESWIDVTAGQPSCDDFFCIRATPLAIPLSSSIPYHFDVELAAKSQQIIQSMRQGEKPWALPSSSTYAPAQRFSSLLAEKARQVFNKLKVRKP